MGDTATASDGIHELTVDLHGSPYYSDDMAPTTRAQRRWGMKDLAVLWISMSACIPTYMLASGLINQGMNWKQAILTIFLGNLIVLVPMVLNAHAGTKYGIPFPVYCRASFGILGANVPALLRALVACGWFGIQTWIGGQAVYSLLAVFFPQWKELPALFSHPAIAGGAAADPGWGINAAQFACFLAFWLVNMAVIYKGIESIRVLLNIKAPLLIALGLALLAWAYHTAGGFGEMLSKPSQFEPGGVKAGQFWPVFILALTGNVSFWATLALNIPDFSRYARSQRDQAWGQILGLPTTMGLYSFIGVAVTSAALVIYKDLPAESQGKLWDPVFLLSQFKNPVLLVFAMAALGLATLATNIAANVVGPANDFAHMWPRIVTFRVGGFITGVIGILIQPWRLLANADIYIDKWLVGISPLLGAVGGILIADYFVIRRTQLDQPGLYCQHGPYWYRGGINPAAMIALFAGVALCVPGFLAKLGVFGVEGAKLAQGVVAPKATIAPLWADLYNFAWFVSFGVAFGVYLVIMKLASNSEKQD